MKRRVGEGRKPLSQEDEGKEEEAVAAGNVATVAVAILNKEVKTKLSKSPRARLLRQLRPRRKHQLWMMLSISPRQRSLLRRNQCPLNWRNQSNLKRRRPSDRKISLKIY